MTHVSARSLVYLLASGVFLLALLAAGQGYISRGAYVILIRIGLLLCAGVLVAGVLPMSWRRMVQWKSMDEPSTEEAAVPKPAAETVEVLSPEEARVWVDDFLVKQQKK